ncbi:Ctr copper transporter [Stachybotrys elegans]|uniref:Copper transport protein n=1 Tax=Stachybotrys elegans TaxID=80388 RepID=A0A8K0SSI7_9HYPO|nr:Ctr copper transporter [Stachybotrys elegans]
MLWNWTTIDACFLSSSWRITSNGTFAATCIGVILLVIAVEFFRRVGKEYDALLMRQFQRRAAMEAPALAARGCAGGIDDVAIKTFTFRASPLQQLARALLHAITFAGAYITMLLAMYFNGYIIICIFIGAALGKFLCDWLSVTIDLEAYTQGRAEAKGIEETTVCCG